MHRSRSRLAPRQSALLLRRLSAPRTKWQEAQWLWIAITAPRGMWYEPAAQIIPLKQSAAWAIRARERETIVRLRATGAGARHRPRARSARPPPAEARTSAQPAPGAVSGCGGEGARLTPDAPAQAAPASALTARAGARCRAARSGLVARAARRLTVAHPSGGCRAAGAGRDDLPLAHRSGAACCAWNSRRTRASTDRIGATKPLLGGRVAAVGSWVPSRSACGRPKRAIALCPGNLEGDRLMRRGQAAAVDGLVREARRLPGSSWRRQLGMGEYELVEQRRLAVATNVAVYFCNPSSPWQRGSNGKTHGR